MSKPSLQQLSPLQALMWWQSTDCAEAKALRMRTPVVYWYEDAQLCTGKIVHSMCCLHMLAADAQGDRGGPVRQAAIVSIAIAHLKGGALQAACHHPDSNDDQPEEEEEDLQYHR